MALEREEWRRQRERTRTQETRQREPMFRQLAQAEVAADRLTSSEEWNWFLQIVQALRDQAQAGLAQIEENDRSNYEFSYEELSRAKSARLVWSERIRVLDEMLDIPASALTDGESARRKLDEIVGTDAA